MHAMSSMHAVSPKRLHKKQDQGSLWDILKHSPFSRHFSVSVLLLFCGAHNCLAHCLAQLSCYISSFHVHTGGSRESRNQGCTALVFSMPQVVGEAAIMALCCLLLVALSVVYPVAAFEAGEQGRVHTKTESGVVTSGLPETVVNNSELQVQSLRSRKQGGHSHGRDILSDSQTQGPACTSKDISIVQNPSAPNPAGIPRFKVEILNTCVSGCPPSNIHLNCGEFASGELLNPDVFKRLATDDCLVNGGRAVPQGTLIAFTYANSLMYPLSFKSATFC